MGEATHGQRAAGRLPLDVGRRQDGPGRTDGKDAAAICENRQTMDVFGLQKAGRTPMESEHSGEMVQIRRGEDAFVDDGEVR